MQYLSSHSEKDESKQKDSVFGQYLEKDYERRSPRFESPIFSKRRFYEN